MCFLFALQRVDQMWSMFNQYVKTRTQDNFKFWIVSLCCSSSTELLFLFVCFFFPLFLNYFLMLDYADKALSVK